MHQISIFQGGRVIFQHTNQSTRENIASILFRKLAGAWAGIFSSPPETFQHRIDGRSNIRSAAKSIVALLIGIALRDGLISSLDQTLGDLLPDEFTPSIDSTKRDISLRHLLTMTTVAAMSAIRCGWLYSAKKSASEKFTISGCTDAVMRVRDSRHFQLEHKQAFGPSFRKAPTSRGKPHPPKRPIHL